MSLFTFAVTSGSGVIGLLLPSLLLDGFAVMFGLIGWQWAKFDPERAATWPSITGLVLGIATATGTLVFMGIVSATAD